MSLLTQRDQARESLQRAKLEARATGRPVLFTTATQVDELDPIDAFERAGELAADRVLWLQPSTGESIVGAGVAWSTETSGEKRVERADRAWRDLISSARLVGLSALPAWARPIAVGGFAFDDTTGQTPDWHAFPGGRLVVPRTTFVSRGGQTVLLRSQLVDRETGVDDASSWLLSDSDTSFWRARVKPRSRQSILAPVDERPAAEWMSLVERTAASIRDGAFKKIVLARAVRVEALEPIDPDSALRSLASNYPTCTVFGIVRGRDSFVGATPERLTRVENGHVDVSCLAGTIRRGRDKDEDIQLGVELIASAKNRIEHAAVVDTLRQQLTDSCDELMVPNQPVLMTMPNVHHLHTPITGRIRAGHTLLTLVARLHPTPAVGGLPREAALDYLRANENLDRGWYAGPIGWIDSAGDGEFRVALRSGLLRQVEDGAVAEALLYAGCGIVGDSEPESEYLESKLKLRPMLGALGDRP